MLLTGDGRRFEGAVGPSLPPDWLEAMNGMQIGPGAASCGTAAYRGEAVEVEDTLGLKPGGLAREDGVHSRKVDFEADKVALALMHGDEAEADQQKGQDKGQVVVVIHRPEQHCKRHQCVDQANAGWQDVDAAGAECCYGWIDALTLLGPALDTLPD